MRERIMSKNDGNSAAGANSYPFRLAVLRSSCCSHGRCSSTRIRPQRTTSERRFAANCVELRVAGANACVRCVLGNAAS